MRIVFVHLNSQLPGFLKENIKYCRDVFPSHEVVLIHNQAHLRADLADVTLFKYSPDSRWRELEGLYGHDKEFRNNFWLTSTARFFALEAFMGKSLGTALHVESDVLLAPDFPFDNLQKLPCELAYPIISDLRGVASTLFIRDKKAGQLLTSNIIKEVSKDPFTTEMIMLKKLYEDNRKLIMPLPIGPNSTFAYNNEARECIDLQLEVHKLLGGAVDGVDVGQYFFGTDPRNRRGRVVIRRNLVNGFAKIEDWKLTFNKSRSFVDIELKGDYETTRMFSLHLPVKRRRLFKQSKRLNLLKKYARDSVATQETKFLPDVFLQAIWQSLNRRIKKLFS